jgi:chromodomain-helicase-DNA-binding protein 1
MMIDIANDIIENCEQAVKTNEVEKKAKAASGQTLTPTQKSKAVLVTFRNVGNINADYPTAFFPLLGFSGGLLACS